MMISEKQHQANIHNAQKSTGPLTSDGKEAVRFNALQHGLRARSILLPTEKPAEFHQLCADLEAEWQPQTYTERLLVEQLAVNQWMLRRLAERQTCAWLEIELRIENAYALLDRISNLIARHERSFAKTVRDLQHLQKHRPVSAPPQSAPEPVRVAAPHPEPPPESGAVAYLMADAAAPSAVISDTR
jgi:hypothetical protein